MGFGRDLGAALTMGLSTTTKHKEAEKAYKKHYDAHGRRVAAFNEAFEQAANSVQRLDAEYSSAREAVLSSGAMVVDDEGDVIYGWYRPVEGNSAETGNIDRKQAVVGSLPAFGVAVGAPALTWTIVGAFGTSATGAAISALSGAAAGAATAAWIGKAATLGIAGMTAGRVALGPIALLSAPVQVAIGAKVAGNREQRAIQRYNEATSAFEHVENIMSDLKAKLAEHDRTANGTAANLSRHAGQLETAEPNSVRANQPAARLDLDMRQALVILHGFAETVGLVREKLTIPDED